MLRRKNKIDIVEYTEDFYSVRNVVLKKLERKKINMESLFLGISM